MAEPARTSIHTLARHARPLGADGAEQPSAPGRACRARRGTALGAAALLGGVFVAGCTGPTSPLAQASARSAALSLSDRAPCAELEGRGLARLSELNAGRLWVWPAFPRVGEPVRVAYESSLVIGTSWRTVGVDVRTTVDAWASAHDVALTRACTADESVEIFAGTLGAFPAGTTVEFAVAHRALPSWGLESAAWFNNGGRNYVVGVGEPLELSARAPADSPPVFFVGGNLWTAPEGCASACDAASFWVDLSVASLAWDKQVGVLWSLDGWTTHGVAMASFEHGALAERREQWGVDVQLPAGAGRDTVVELAAFTQMAGQTWLDPRSHVLRFTSGRIVEVGAFPDILHDQADAYLSAATDPPGVWAHVSAFWSVNGGPEQEAPMAWSARGAYDNWLVHLGPQLAGTVVRYRVEARHVDGALFTDDDAGAGYLLEFFAPAAVDWVGDVHHWPATGAIPAGGSLWFNVHASPPDAAFDAELRYRVDEGEWQAVLMTRDEAPRAGRDHFWFRLDGAPAGAHVQYAIQVRDRAGTSHWQNNDGADFHAFVNR